MKKRYVTQLLHIGDIDDEDLMIILEGVCPRTAQFRRTEVEYRTKADEVVLTLIYRQGQIAEATAGPALTPALEAQLATAIEAELQPRAERMIRRSILFCDRPVTGFWRYHDDFQLVPVPANAPRPREIHAQHPLMLDVTVEPSDNWAITQQRTLRRTYDIALVLSLALRPVVSIPGVRARKHWVLIPLDDSRLSFEPRWCQEGYFPEGIEPVTDALPETVGLDPIPQTPAAEYFGARYMEYPDIVSVPLELADIFDIVETLAGSEHDRFLRACYWQYTANVMWDYSHSLYLTSLINSVECLATVGPERKSPDGVANQFKAFLRQYGPGTPSGTRIN